MGGIRSSSGFDLYIRIRRDCWPCVGNGECQGRGAAIFRRFQLESCGLGVGLDCAIIERNRDLGIYNGRHHVL
jgi:hypothetical protein